MIFAAMAIVAAPAQAKQDYAGIVMDAKTGKVLYSHQSTAKRYPASLTKMMTLYLLFEALDNGQATMKTRIRFSKHAASMQPSKLGVKAGSSISVQQAIYALAIKSANDAAAAVGEHLGGSESRFGEMMTAKARSLGMKNTVFKNASGLPDSRQYTTARDMALLGIALREHYPHYYKYFSTRSFKFGKHQYSNHNRLLGQIRGYDGIKTGYTRASGFNLVSSVNTGGRSIVAVVMGGRSGASRNAQMVKLVNEYLPKASKRDKGPLLASRKGGTAYAALDLPKKSAPVPTVRPRSSGEAARPVIAEAPQVAAAAVAPRPKEELPAADIDPITTASPDRSGWVIQVASLPTQTEAVSVIARTKAKAGTILASAEGFTEVFQKDSNTYYRARFGGFGSKSAAWNACAALKKKKIACYAVAN